MSKLPKIAVSIGDPNGIGLELLLKSHDIISEFCEPVYCCHTSVLEEASSMLKLETLKKLNTMPPNLPPPTIEPSKLSKEAGGYSFASFKMAVELAKNKKVDAITTLPIHKKGWELAKIKYKGHTDALREFFAADAIMMLGCSKLYVALYSEHIPLREVIPNLSTKRLTTFLINLYSSINTYPIAVLGVNPHAGDSGVLGDEERYITEAISLANKALSKEVFVGPIVPDIAFTPNMRKKFTYFVAIYHDQGLAPLKALYFDESINISLNLPIVRTSVDHGCAFDIAYKNKANRLSYINAVRAAASFSNF
jgi:4-hydroxythreonine-4-phosphate dehydrogenase